MKLIRNIFLLFLILNLIIVNNCQQAGSSGGGGRGDDEPPSKWASQSKKIASDAGDDDWFGNSVSMSGDYAIVGAYYKNGIGTCRGAAYVFYRTGTNTWGDADKIIATDPNDLDCFGESVSISGDYAIVGASNEDGAGTDRGAAYIFHNREGTNAWDFVSKIIAYDPEDGSIFGASVSLSGEYAIIGAQYKDGLGINSGAAYILK